MSKKYTLRVGGAKLPIATTDESISETIGKRLSGAKPQTQVDRSGGYSIGFSKQQITQSELREVRRMRESGGLIATAFHIKATIKFGGGVEFQAKDDELEAWLEDTLDGIDNLILDIGEDALWYPYSLGEIVETRTGDFSHIECIEPWTMLPETDEYGDIVRWQQKLQGGQTDIFEPEEIGSIILNKASGRDKTGISEALRNREEIEAFRAYQKSIREVDERIGFPFRHVKAGRDGGAQLNDQQLRRIRNRTNDIGAGETLTTGKDIEIDHENPMEGVDTSNIQERNMRMLATALGLPIELLNEGSDGLGSGMPAELRKELLALQNEADRRRIDDQFTEQFLRPIVKQYSDFDHTQDMGLTIAPFLDKKRDMAELISSVGEYMTTNEVREKLDMAPVDDEEVGESYRSPADQEEPEDEGGPFGGGEGLFSDGRALSVPDNAVSISDRSEAPEGASIVEGDRGGLYYIPAGEEAETTPGNVFDESSEEVFVEVAGSEEVGEQVANLSQTWTGWPTDGQTAPMWVAASEMTNNDNDPGDPFGDPLIRPDVDQEAVEAYQEYQENLTEKLREEHGDNIQAHRFIHGEVAERLQAGEDVDARTLGSWTTDDSQIPDLVDEVAPDPDAARENAVVVSMDIPVENVMDYHEANPALDDAGQQELIAALDFGSDLSDGDIQTLDELS